MERLSEIIAKICNIGVDRELEYTADMILDCATRIYNAEKINGKRNGAVTITGEEIKMASQKQKDFLNKHTSMDEKEINGMSSKIASTHIEEVMKKWKSGN